MPSDIRVPFHVVNKICLLPDSQISKLMANLMNHLECHVQACTTHKHIYTLALTSLASRGLTLYVKIV